MTTKFPATRADIVTELEDALWFLRTNDPAELDNVQRCCEEALLLVKFLIQEERAQ